MGLLTLGKALDATATAAISGYIREHGISQFLHTYNRVKNIAGDELRFGDEIECGVFVVDPVTKTVKLSVRSRQLLDTLDEKELRMSHQTEGVTWHPEFGNWMIESTPNRPYSNYASDLLRVERNMVLRRRRLLSALREDEIAPYVTCYPMMGVDDYIHDPQPYDAPYSQSSYLPDYIVNPHPRFAALTSNIRNRRGQKVEIINPLYKDTFTPEYYIEQNPNTIQIENDTTKNNNIKYIHFNNRTYNLQHPRISPNETQNKPAFSLEPDTNIHMDAMGFGMGMCCLQVTFQARDIDESRYIYDQLAVLAPIMLAMTAATPFFKGRISDVDVRWNSIAQSVDDRTPAERGAVLPGEDITQYSDPHRAGNGIRPIPKSRYDSVSTYIYHCKGDPACRRTFEKYNDIPCPVDTDVKNRLLQSGVDENLAHHISHLFIRDPLVVFEEKIELDDTQSMEHFENIQSTNWQTCRWKPPPPRTKPEDPHIGWRTEFRSMEVQLTDFENAAYTVFVVLVTRVVLAFDLALYIPLSKVDENMKRAHIRDSIRQQKFYFRKHMAPPPANTTTSVIDGIPETPRTDLRETIDKLEDNYEEMTMNEIFHGKDCYYPGLIPLVSAYLDYINTDPETRKRVDLYLDYISKKAKGETVTTATWMRDFVLTHPSYQHDSILTQEITYDLLMACKHIGEGVINCPEILGDITIDRVRPEDAYGQVLEGRLPTEERRKLIKRLMKRARHTRPDTVARGTSVTTDNTGTSSDDSDNDMNNADDEEDDDSAGLVSSTTTSTSKIHESTSVSSLISDIEDQQQQQQQQQQQVQKKKNNKSISYDSLSDMLSGECGCMTSATAATSSVSAAVSATSLSHNHTTMNTNSSSSSSSSNDKVQATKI